MKLFFILIIIAFPLNYNSCQSERDLYLIHGWSPDIQRYFLGEMFWGNRLQDWQIHQGRLECIGGNEPLRTVHILDHELSRRKDPFEISVRIGTLHREAMGEDAIAGLLIGAGPYNLDYRGRSLVFGHTGKEGGIIAGINAKGEPVILDMENNLVPLVDNIPENTTYMVPDAGFTLVVKGIPAADQDEYQLTLQIISAKVSVSTAIPASRLEGNIALISHHGNDASGQSYWFDELKLKGSKFDFNSNRTIGPIVSTQHTLSRKVLRIKAQMMPVGETDPQEAYLQYKLKDQSEWKNQVIAPINPAGYVAVFTVEPWNDTKDYDYRVLYRMKNNQGIEQEYIYGGTIKRNPTDKEVITVAAFTGNNNTSWQSNAFDRTSIFFPHEDLAGHVAVHEPDFLFYSGDQLYEGSPSPPDRTGGKSSMLDYLYKWYLWCWAHRDLTRNTPSVCIPDDHDVFHGNLWGDGGSIPPQAPPGGVYPAYYRGGFESHWIQDQGGYRMGTDFVNMVERTQTSHLPDPHDPRPVKNKIGVYYTSVLYGGIDFAVLEDRKFKSPPGKILPDARIVNGFSQIENFDATRADKPEAILLGDRQLQFIKDWTADWKDVFMKVSLTQTIFADVCTYPDSFKTDAGTPRLQPLPQGVIPKDYSLAKDMDSNGWPQSGRDRALEELRKGFTFMIAGDQHLGSVVHHGIDEWEDAGVSFCVPSVANVWPRRWFPPRPGLNRDPEKPEYTGRYFDGFGNRITVFAVSNPYKSGIYPEELNDRAPGYGIVKLNKKDQTITIECWPRHIDPSQPGAEQYPGWPVLFNLEDNYGKKPVYWLPTLSINNLENPPVVQIINENTGEILYTVRAKTNMYNPKVFGYGLYTLRVGEPGTLNIREFKGLRTQTNAGSDTLEIAF